jgi:hypothetical protein
MSNLTPDQKRRFDRLFHQLDRNTMQLVEAAIRAALSEVLGDAGTLRPGVLPQLAGDVTGRLATTLVARLRGIAIEVAAPSDQEVLTYDAASNTLKWTAASGVSRVQDEGGDLPQRLRLNFIGTLVAAADDAANGRINVTVTDPVPPHEAAADPHPQYTTAAELATALAAYIAKSLVDAKGDLIVGSANDVPTRLAVGANGTVPLADASQAVGIRWGRPRASDLASRYEPVTSGGPSAPEVVFDASGDVVMSEVSQ